MAATFWGFARALCTRLWGKIIARAAAGRARGDKRRRPADRPPQPAACSLHQHSASPAKANLCGQRKRRQRENNKTSELLTCHNSRRHRHRRRRHRRHWRQPHDCRLHRHHYHPIGHEADRTSSRLHHLHNHPNNHHHHRIYQHWRATGATRSALIGQLTLLAASPRFLLVPSPTRD